MSNNLPIIRFVFDRRKKATVSVASSVELEIYFSRNQRRRLSTGVKLYAGQWDDKLHAINRTDGILINARLTAVSYTHLNQNTTIHSCIYTLHEQTDVL